MITWAKQFGFLVAPQKDMEYTRMQLCYQNKEPPPLPRIIRYNYLVEAIQELGFTWPAGMGDKVPLPFNEIEAYSRATGGLTPSEIRLVRRMSEAFISGYLIGQDPLGKEPWPERDPITDKPIIDQDGEEDDFDGG